MRPFFLNADRLFDGTQRACLSRPVLRIQGDRVQTVSFRSAASGTGNTLGHDFPGCTILPGLIDTHVHLVFSALETNEAIIAQVTRETDEELERRAFANAQAALRVGLTTIRDCGGRGRVVQRVRDRIRGGEVVGPDIYSCGAPITTRTGHCHWLGLVADTPDEVRAAVERMLTEDADFLKVMATGGNMTRGSDPMRAQYDPATLALIADLGRRANRYTAAHVLSRAALPGAVAARVRTLEHCDWRVDEDRYEFDPALATQMIEHGQFIGLTMSATTRRKFLPQIAADPSGPVRRLDARFACERRMIEFGVRYTLHSDAGVRLTPIDTFAVGLQTAVLELRLSPADVLLAVTSTAAAALELADRGTVAPGQRADLVIVEGNPLDDIGCLHRVRAVMKAGQWVDLEG